MRWHYTLIRYEKPIYIYAYGRENSPVDGEISYNEITGKITVKPCTLDAGEGVFALEMAEEHFYKVIRDGFPNERQVDCG